MKKKNYFNPEYKIQRNLDFNYNFEVDPVNFDPMDAFGLINDDNVEEKRNKLKRTKIGKSDQECLICLEKYSENDEVSFLNCFHFFHGECIEKWIKNKINSNFCPICKTLIN